MDWTFRVGDLALVFAALLGPVLAIQAQKWVERWRAKRDRRLSIFRTLMATRAAPLSPTHVEALNAIPLEFFGHAAITAAWKNYVDHLSSGDPTTQLWRDRRLEEFNSLLLKIAKQLGYGFTELEIKREAYSPVAHGKIEADQEIIRRGLVDLLQGKSALPMEVRSLPAARKMSRDENERARGDDSLPWPSLAASDGAEVTQDEKCSAEGCNDKAAVEVRLANPDGSMSDRPDPKLTFLCPKHYLAERPPRLYYHFLLGRAAPRAKARR